jgi:hypothetical protein
MAALASLNSTGRVGKYVSQNILSELTLPCRIVGMVNLIINQGSVLFLIKEGRHSTRGHQVHVNCIFIIAAAKPAPNSTNVQLIE